jgi:Contractile injection system tube protein
MEFKQATLEEVEEKPSANPKPATGAAPAGPIRVQINPASLRLQMSNNVDAGKAHSRPSTQSQGSSSSTLSFDLLFDTADEGTTEEPVDVRTRTRHVERFLLPMPGTAKAVPPRVRFTYGTLTVVGVMTSLNQDFDFFSMNGVPLRAKCAVTIKEQKPEFDAKLKGSGANKGAGAVPPLPPRPGSGAGSRAAPADRTGTALGGESAAGFAARMGLDPRAWKDFAGGLGDPLRLEAGLQIDFSSSASTDIGLGVQVGATQGVLPDDAGTAAAPGPLRPPEGPALTAAGGLTRALNRASASRSHRAAEAARASFQAAPAAPAGVVSPGPAGAAPAVPAGSPAPAATSTADPRAAGYGFGVPLRDRRGVTTGISEGLVHQRGRGATASPLDGIPESDDPTVPRWAVLRSAGAGGQQAGRSRHQPARCRCGGLGGGCGCKGGCGCAGGQR